MEPEGVQGQSTTRRRRTVRLRTLLIWLAVLPTVAMGTQVAVTAGRLIEQSEQLRADVAVSERVGAPLYTLMVDIQAERTVTASLWAGAAGAEEELSNRREATDRATAAFRGLAADPNASFGEVNRRLEGLAAYRQRADAHTGGADGTLAYYTGAIGAVIQAYQQEFNHAEDAELGRDSRSVVSMLSATEMVAREDTILALAGPSRELNSMRLRPVHQRPGSPSVPVRDMGRADSARGGPAVLRADHRHPGLADEDPHRERDRLEAHGHRIRHQAARRGRRLAVGARELLGADGHAQRRPGAEGPHARRGQGRGAGDRGRLADRGSGGGLLVVVVVVVFTTRSVLRRLHDLHERTVTVAEETLPDVVARLQRGQSIDVGVLPEVRGDRDEVGRISDAFARAVAVSVDGHRQLAAERHGFGLFATGIASRTGNLVSRQLSLTEDLQDAFGHDEELLAQLMRADQLTVGMRRQIENLLILAGGEVPDPHSEPMRIADLLREAAAEVEDFRRIERQALDETSVEPRVISQISHLLAELLDNATRFSPPRSKVVIRAEMVADGLSVEIEDRGPRVTPSGTRR